MFYLLWLTFEIQIKFLRMKKIILLFTAVCFSASASFGQAQSVVKQDNHQVASDYYNANAPMSTSAYKKTRGVGESFPSTIGTKHVVGKTTYDLQTNGSLQNRIMVQGANIHTAWTLSTETNVTATSAFADRGTGYAFFDGSLWSTPPTARIEPSTRTGFGAMGINGTGNVVYASHSAAYNILLSEKTGAVWNTVQTTLTNTNTAVWPDMATSGNWMYLITASQDSVTKSNGIRYGYFFSRSNDNGATWMDNMIPMPLIDSVGHYSGGGNSYSISARDSVVVIVFGDFGTDLTMLRSVDYGATWSKSLIYDFPINNYRPGDISDFDNDFITDTLFSLDGGINLALDVNGEAHVAFSMYVMFNDGTSGFYRPFTSSMWYYNSIVDSFKVVDEIFSLHHRGCDGDTATFTNPTNYTRTNPASQKAQYNTGSFMTQPQITVNDANNDVYITYTSIVDGDLTEIDPQHPYWFGTFAFEGQPYRDVFVLASKNYGATFGFPVNISRTGHYEEAFPSVPEVINGSDLHVLYQGDIEPGTILTNSDIYDGDFQNWMIYQKVSTADIFTASADIDAPCMQFQLPLAINEVKLANGLVKVYPNPSVDFITVELQLNNTAENVSYEMYDITGRLISSVIHNNVATDKVQINVQSLATGSYILKVKADNAVSTHKISVK